MTYFSTSFHLTKKCTHESTICRTLFQIQINLVLGRKKKQKKHLLHDIQTGKSAHLPQNISHFASDFDCFIMIKNQGKINSESIRKC